MKQFIYCPECGMPILATVKSDLRLPDPLTKSYIFKCEYCECEGFDYEVNPAKAVSIRQPWTYLVAAGIKPIENRTWPTKYRGPVLLHAGAKSYSVANLSASQWASLDNETKKNTINSVFQTSVIIGIAKIVDCVRNHPSIWAEKDCWNWVMDKPILFEKPIIKVKGKLSFFIPTID